MLFLDKVNLTHIRSTFNSSLYGISFEFSHYPLLLDEKQLVIMAILKYGSWIDQGWYVQRLMTTLFWIPYFLVLPNVKLLNMTVTLYCQLVSKFTKIPTASMQSMSHYLSQKGESFVQQLAKIRHTMSKILFDLWI